MPRKIIQKYYTSSAKDLEKLKVFWSYFLLPESESCYVVFDNVSHLLKTSITALYIFC